VIMGFSQGAMLAHALLLREQLTMLGLAGCSGRMIREFVSDGSSVRQGQPVFLSHGTYDEVIPVVSGHELRNIYESQTGADVTWSEEPVGHDIGLIDRASKSLTLTPAQRIQSPQLPQRWLR
jgi:predicted esterase